MIDFCISKDAVQLDNEVDHILQQIDLLFSTRPDEVLGLNYGTNYSIYLHELNIGSKSIANTIKADITDNVNLLGWQVDVEVEFMVGTEHDIMIIAIQLSKDTNVYSKAYKLTEYLETYDPDEYIMDA